MNVEQAYARCEEITATEARNFSYGIKLLPPPKRRAMSALYALARRIDDIGDGDGEPAAKLAALAEARKEVGELRSDHPVVDPDDPVMTAVADVAGRYPLPVNALEELIEGCEMDVTGTRYETFDDLVGYCRRVAGTVGRLSLSIYGTDRPEQAEGFADDLGVALQITNILRDIVEDQRSLGRVYLPVADLARFNLGPDLEGEESDLVALIAFETARAEEWYGRGLPLLPMLDRRSRACTAAMAGIYHRLLANIRRGPAGVLRGRMSLPAWQKSAVAIRALTSGRV
ncbi:MAG TPA: squalene/phytoene synthase family protein [Acidimicrobiales bacterium]|nr:squalene/phytoene synthase family protein [Acidimicrobiales bacterium]